jgi:hypothetical protein
VTLTGLEIWSSLLNRGDRDTIGHAGGDTRVGGCEGFDGAVSGDVALQDDPLIMGEGGGALDAVGSAGDGVRGSEGEGAGRIRGRNCSGRKAGNLSSLGSETAWS